MNNEAAINVSVSSHYREASYASEVISPGILGERVEVLEAGPLFTLIKQADGYMSWIGSDQLAREDMDTGSSTLLRSHFVSLHKQPAADAEAIRNGVIGCRLPVREEQNGWVRYNSFRQSDPDFSPVHLATFVSVNRYPLDHGAP